MCRPLKAIVRKNVFLWIFALCAATHYAPAQSPPLLEWADFRTRVAKNHPAAKQADLFREAAEAAILRARGGFDVKAYAETDGKNFKDKTYYRYSEAGLKWPTLAGLEFKGNYNAAVGNFVNPEAQLPEAGQAALGLNWTLGQGLIVDERRTALRLSRIGAEQNRAESDLLYNNLFYAAAGAYYGWVLADNQSAVIADALAQARIRFEALKESVAQGDKPAVDTLEAFILVQNRMLELTLAGLERQNGLLDIRNYLWTPDGAPEPETPYAAPDLTRFEYPAPSREKIAELLQRARENHPELRLYRTKIQSLEAERFLKKEKLKPVLDLQYQLLGSGWSFFPSEGGNFSVLADDVKFGIQFAYPLQNRKARGDLQLADIKINQTRYELQQKTLALENKLNAYGNLLENLYRQIEAFRSIIDNRRALLDAELEKFNFGESSIFLINTREQSLLDARVKWLKILAEYRKTELALQWSAGVF